MDEIVEKEMDKTFNEGIDFDPETKTVAYNSSHENYVDISIENNPTIDGEIVPGVQVWSIFKRKKGETREDGNPLAYALKGEGWTFRSEEDREAIEKQFDLIPSKFVSMYQKGITVIIPSGNELNKHIADIVLSKSENGEFIEGWFVNSLLKRSMILYLISILNSENITRQVLIVHTTVWIDTLTKWIKN